MRLDAITYLADKRGPFSTDDLSEALGITERHARRLVREMKATKLVDPCHSGQRDRQAYTANLGWNR